MYLPGQILDQFKKQQNRFQSILKSLKRGKIKKLDERFAEAHDAVFEQINCLDCSNCCKTTSPMLFARDIENLAGYLRIKPGDFVQQYLFLDNDGIYAFKQTPCPFLGDDNHCAVYEDRPKACREFPHTNQRKMHTLLNLAEKNAAICPAVQQILIRLENY